HDLFLVHQEFSRARGIDIKIMGRLIGVDMSIDQRHLAPFDAAVAVLQLSSPITQRLHLATSQNDACFEPFFDVVVEAGTAVDADGLFFGVRWFGHIQGHGSAVPLLYQPMTRLSIKRTSPTHTAIANKVGPETRDASSRVSG